MTYITKEVKVSIKLEAYELAQLFWGLDDLEQAEFFNELGFFIKNNDSSFEIQMQSVMTNQELNEYGRLIMSTIGKYSSLHHETES